jgi:uncharacterized protein YndB with AHSA1/START domain
MTDQTRTNETKTDDAASGETLLGTLRYENGSGTVRMEDVYDTDIGDLWSAIVEPERLARWVAEVTGDLRVGGKFQATFTSGWVGSGTVDVCDAPKRLHITLDPDPGDDSGRPMTLEAWLTAHGDKTRLVVEDSGFSRDDLPGHGAGWQAHFEDLSAYLGGRESAGWENRWRALMPPYEELAATQD